MGTDDRTGAGGTAGEPHWQDEQPGGPPHEEAAARALETLQRLTLLERRVEELRRTRAERDTARSELARLRAIEARYQTLVETSPDCIWEVDLHGQYTYLSPHFRHLTGYSPQAFLGRSPADLAPPDRAAACREEIYGRLAACQPFTGEEMEVVRADGQSVVVEVSGTPWVDANGACQGMRGISRDITARRRTEQELEQLLQLFTTSPDLMCIFEPNGRLRRINPACRELLGYTEAELLGRPLTQLVHPEDRKHTLAEVRSSLAGNGPQVIRNRYCCKDGTVRWFSWQGYHDPAAGLVYATARDISELVLAEKQLEAINIDLERRVEQRSRELHETQKQYLHAEKLSAIGKLSASIAHEFNNPLQGIMTVLKGLRRRAVLEEEDRRLLEMAISESERMRDLIRNLQDFNRPSSGLRSRMDLHACLDSLLLLQKSDLKNKSIEIERDYAADLPPVQAVADQIKQVLLNLLSNAAESCQEPGSTITVTTRLEGERVAISISDTGVGIRPEEMGSIFQPFFTTKAAVKGTGLGLPVSWGIIRNHGGEIRVDSEPGKGATFTVLLPVAGDAPQAKG
ncbi:MAG: PAS domain S-box protein [Desulfobulbus sp.]|jgi:PAS domain S-box-containing protein|nr:PAS domain S-box protein [Desulfobulbus sp.]